MTREGESLSEQMRQRYPKTDQILERHIGMVEAILASRKGMQGDVGYEDKVRAAEDELNRLREIYNAFLSGDIHKVGVYLGGESEELRVMLATGEHPMEDREEFLAARKELGFVE